MASFQDNINALKEAGLGYSEILQIMSDSVDGHMNTEILSNNTKSGHELPTNDSNITSETHSVHKRKAGVFSIEKQHKSFRQSSPGLTWEREEVPFDYSFH